MKKSFLKMASFAFCTTLLVACNPNSPEKRTVNPMSCRDVILQYFPYSIDEHFVFENDETKEKKELDAYCKDGKTYPTVTMHNAGNADSIKSHGDWNVLVSAEMLAEDNEQAQGYTPGGIYFLVSGSIYNPKCVLSMHSVLAFELNEQYYASKSERIDTTEFFSYFTDTITIPLLSQKAPTREDLPEGACVHIVKNKGITDFSLDGKSVWRRVF